MEVFLWACQEILGPLQALGGFSQTVPVPLIPSSIVPPAGAL